MTRTALLGAAAAGSLTATALGVTALGMALGAPSAPAFAAPADIPVLAAPAGSTAGDDADDPDRPVRITVGRFEPRTITPGSLVTVTGTLTNTGPTTITDLSLRLQRGAVL